MGLVSLLPIVAFLLARTGDGVPAAGPVAAETLAPAPALAAAILLVGAVRLARGRRRVR